MKFSVVGCGALGGYYGAMLARAGEDVRFLLRSDFDAVRRNGLRIESPKGGFHLNPKCASDPAEIGTSDVVLIGLKTTANDQFAVLLPPLLGKATLLVTLQNGLGNEERLARLFGPANILGGLCFVCLNRVTPGVIHHIAHGTIVLGEFQRWPEPRTHDLASRFKHAGVPCRVTDSLERAHWEKLVWNIPFNGLGVAGAAGLEACLSGFVAPRAALGTVQPTDLLLGDERWTALVRELMLEIIAAGRALGHDIPETLADGQIERTRGMGAYKASTLIDFEQGRPLEMESMFLEPLRQARAAGVASPRLAALCRVLESIASR